MIRVYVRLSPFAVHETITPLLTGYISSKVKKFKKKYLNINRTMFEHLIGFGLKTSFSEVCTKLFLYFNLAFSIF